MINYALLLLLSDCLFISSAWAQDAPSRSIIKTIDRGDYIFIPAAAFEPQVQEVIYQYKGFNKSKYTQVPIEFSWSSICNDGHYSLTITPEQIYFTDGHNNPNPNHLYWTITIDQYRYEMIKRAVLHHPPTGFYNLSNLHEGTLLAYKDKFSDLKNVPVGWSDERFATYCAAQKSRQLAKLFALINSSFKNPQLLVRSPTQDTPKLFNYDVQEVLKQLPQALKKNKDDK